MDEQEFKNRADRALDDLYRRLLIASERHDFEADFGGGALVIEFEAPPAKFVVSPNAPVSQVWAFGADEELQAGLEPRAESLRGPRIR